MWFMWLKFYPENWPPRKLAFLKFVYVCMWGGGGGGFGKLASLSWKKVILLNSLIRNNCIHRMHPVDTMVFAGVRHRSV